MIHRQLRNESAPNNHLYIATWTLTLGLDHKKIQITKSPVTVTTTKPTREHPNNHPSQKPPKIMRIKEAEETTPKSPKKV